MARLGRFWRWFTDWLTLTAARIFAVVLLLSALLIGVLGYLNQYGGWDFGEVGRRLLTDYSANATAELVSIAITVLIIDWLNERREERREKEQLKAQLIREMGSTDNGIALRAVRELRAHEWLEDGSLQGVNLSQANLYRAVLSGADLQEANLLFANLEQANLNGAYLQGAGLHRANLEGANLCGANLREALLVRTNLRGTYLDRADLQGANLYRAVLQEARLSGPSFPDDLSRGANLQGTKSLTNKQLVTANSLRGVRMYSGSRYDGRFNLKEDVELATSRLFDTKTNDPEAMADFYGVSLEDYLAGQEWARENLPRLRREAGLEQEEAAETGDVQQPEEQQSVLASSSAPPAPVVPAQSLLRFTVRRLIGLFWPFGL